MPRKVTRWYAHKDSSPELIDETIVMALATGSVGSATTHNHAVVVHEGRYDNGSGDRCVRLAFAEVYREGFVPTDRIEDFNFYKEI